MTDKETLKKKSMPLLRAVLTAKAKVGIPLHMLCREYEETCMEPLKFREMGYGSLEQFLRDCSDICTVNRASEGFLIVRGIASKEDAHIYKLVSGQKKDKRKSKKVSIAVKRRSAVHFMGGKRPNSRPSNQISSYQGSSLSSNHRTLSYNMNNPYTQLRQTPTKSVHFPPIYQLNNNNLPPRFQKQNNFIGKIQQQVHTKAFTLIQTNSKPQSVNNNIIPVGSSKVKSNLSPSESSLFNSQPVTSELSRISNQNTSFKDILNKYCVQRNIESPLYDTVSVNGCFISTVSFNNNTYDGVESFKTKKEAERHVAHKAWNALAGISSPDPQNSSSSITDEGKLFDKSVASKVFDLMTCGNQVTSYKALINFYCLKKGIPFPTYTSIQAGHGFLSTICFDEQRYECKTAVSNKKVSEHNAAHVAWNVVYGLDAPSVDELTNGVIEVKKNSCSKKVTEPILVDDNECIPYTSTDLKALEKKLQKLLKSKQNGLWATRLRPEFKNMFGELLPDDIQNIIQEHFLSFIKVDSPIPNMVILYLKTDSDKSSNETQPKQKQVEVNNKNVNRNQQASHQQNGSANSSKISNGTPSQQQSPNVSIDRSLPSVKTLSNDLPQLNISDVQSPRYNQRTCVSPLTSEFYIEYAELPNVGDEIKVYICHVESLDRFFIQYADSAIADLVEEMQDFYENDGRSQDIGKPKLNEYCCARYSKDKSWFRSKILSVKEQKNILNESYRCHVIYVDYGNDEYVISTELKHLTDNFCKLPAQAVQCCLHNLYPMEGTTWPEKTIEYFRNATDNVELTMSVKAKNGSVLTIDLIDAEGRSVCAYFASSKYGKSNTSQFDSFLSEGSPRSISPRTSSPSLYDSITLPPSNREIKAKCALPPADIDYVDASVSHINSTKDLAIVLIGAEFDEELDKLEEKMNKFYDRDTVLPSTSLDINNFYAVLYEEYWTRAKLLSVHETEVEVFLLDHGNKTIISKDEIKDLPMQFLDPPFQAIPCSLANVPESFDSEILQYLSENTMRKPIIALIVERPASPGGKMSVELYDTTNESDDININNEIMQKIENEKNLCPTLPDVGQGHCNAYVAHISQEGEVFIQILGPGTEKLEILMEDMTSHFTQTRASEILQRPEVGTICCAKFKEDGAWYRAQVTKVMQKERKVEVEFIDYGNREVIQMLFIRNPNAVNNKVVSLPAQAVKCYISGNSETSMDEETYKRTREFILSLDIVYVTVVGYNDETPVVRIIVPSELEDGEPLDFFKSFHQLEEIRRANESAQDCSSEGSVLLNKNSSTQFQSIANTSFEDISVIGDESFCKINPLQNKDSVTLLSEYDVINNVPVTRERSRSESPAFSYSPAWGIPQMVLTERVIEGVIQDSHDPFKFSFIPFRLWEALETLHVDMMETYRDLPPDNTKFNVHDVCAVYHHKHEIWYRAVIIAKLGDEEVVVKYPDFSGTAEVAFSKNVRMLKPQFKELPFLAVRCTLGGIEPLNGGKIWDSQTCNIFSEMVMNETFQVEVVSNKMNQDFTKPLEVLLHGATSDGKRFIINEKLVKMGFAKKTR